MEIRNKCELYELYQKPQAGISYDSPEILFMQAVSAGECERAAEYFRERKQFTEELPVVDAPYGRFEGREQIRNFAEGFSARFEAEGFTILPMFQTRAGGRSVSELVISFVRDGMITLAKDGSVADWKMFMKSAGMSTYIYVKDPSFHEKAYAYLQDLLYDGVWGFEKIRTVKEAEADYGLSGDFAFILETDGYTGFADSWHEPICNPIDYSNYRLGQATHGYEPEKGPQPVFLGRGPHFKPGAVIPKAEVIDEAPTLARILGQEMPEADGRVLTELLRL